MKRLRITFKGIVQGVGFRPSIYRNAKKFNLTGFVKNTPQGVIAEIEGENVDEFLDFTLKNPPPLSHIKSYNTEKLEPSFTNTFEIHHSGNSGKSDLLISPDIVICDDCKRELFDPTDRRYGYPFINCTNCGPRFTIISDIPYDRPNTTMNEFTMCDACKTEYENPADRRYHAQPVSCFDCGPRLDSDISEISDKILQSGIVAIKGLGGYHLACLANRDTPILRLRRLKNRGNKPFALMGTMEMIEENCYLSAVEKEILQSVFAPILILKKHENSNISKQIAPRLDHIGFMIPYTPLHLLLIKAVNQPLVMTSANQSEESIIYRDDTQQLEKLCDSILSHNRKIQIFTDDSVARVFEDNIYMIRRSRGFAPLPIEMPITTDKTILGLGPMMKTTFTFFYQQRAIMSQYIGTTDSLQTVESERESIRHFMTLFDYHPEIIAVDKHPNYPNRILTSDFPEAEIIEIQHHKAHIASLMAETQEVEDIIGISMDGTGYGDDGKIWGGEFFVGNHTTLNRVGHIKYTFLPSGDKSVKEPWRYALSVLYALYGESDTVIQFADKFGKKGKLLLDAIKSKIGGVETSSCGRLFDAVSCLIDIGDYNTYDGELPSILQTRAEQVYDSTEPISQQSPYKYLIHKEKDTYILDFLPTIHDIIQDTESKDIKAFNFHQTVAQSIVNMAVLLRENHGINKVGLSGGVFQNTLLLSLTTAQLRKNQFQVLIHSEVPPNDGGISLGQAFLGI